MNKIQTTKNRYDKLIKGFTDAFIENIKIDNFQPEWYYDYRLVVSFELKKDEKFKVYLWISI